MQRPEDRNAAEILGRSPLFAALSEGARSELAAASRVVTLGAGQRLWREGAPATSVGLVIAGRCKFVRDDGRRAVIVDVAVPGDLLGAISFTLLTGYSSTVVCLRRARILLVPANLLRRTLQQESHAVAALAAKLAGDVSRLLRMLQHLSAGSVQRRLASVLLELAQRTGQPFPGGLLIPLRLRRADLAALAATTLESVSRAISSWRRRGVVTTLPAGYLLRDLTALKAAAAGD